MLPYLAAANSAPGEIFVVVTPADSDLTNGVCRAIYVGGAGNLVVQDQSGNNTTFTGVLAGTVYPFRAKQIRAATTATSIVAIY